MSVWISAIVTAICSWVLLASIRILASPLRSIPGPRIAALTGGWRIVKYFQGSWMQDIIGLHKQYGPVVRIAPDEVSITDQAAIRNVYGFDAKYRKV